MSTTTQNVTTGNPVPINPPYVVVHIWKRVQ